jgi:probable O-glycosylation ligase (exosortase A-associated)
VANSRLNKKSQKKDLSSAYGWLYILIGYYGFEYVRFQDSIFPFLAPLKIPMFLTLALAYYVISNLKLLPKGKFTTSIFILWAFILIWVPFATNNFYAFQTAKSMSMIFVTVFATVLIVDTSEKLKVFIRYFIFFLALVAIWVITHDGRGPGGFLADENDVALAIVVAIPFAFFIGVYRKEVRSKMIYAILFILMVSAVVLTSSRGGFLGLVVVLFLILCTTKRKIRNFMYVIASILILGGVLITVLPEGYVKDMQSISNSEDSTRNLRLLHWTTAIEIFKDNPVLGVGPYNYPWKSIEYFYLSPYFIEDHRVRSGRQSHSLYFTLIPELGLLGITLFLILLFDFWKKITRLKKYKCENWPESHHQFGKIMAKTLLASMGGFLTAGAFVSVLYYPIFWHLLAISTSTYFIYLKDFHDGVPLVKGAFNR